MTPIVCGICGADIARAGRLGDHGLRCFDCPDEHPQGVLFDDEGAT